ncbi:MAG: hypothetical protein U1F16_06550 [Turneriella sp.]
MIALSLRYKTNDHFGSPSFTKQHIFCCTAKKSIFLDKGDGDNSKEETEANRFAGELLIPEKQYQAFVDGGWFDVGAAKVLQGNRRASRDCCRSVTARQIARAQVSEWFESAADVDLDRVRRC